MKTIIIISIWLILITPFVIYWVTNYRRSTRTDRKLDRKAKEAERKRQDQIFEMNQRNVQLRKFRHS